MMIDAFFFINPIIFFSVLDYIVALSLLLIYLFLWEKLLSVIG